VNQVTNERLFELPDNWTWARLEELVANPRSDIVDGPFGSDMKVSEYVNDGVPIIRLQNVERNVFVKKNIKYITPEKAKDLERHAFRKNDIVMTKLGAPLGKACLVPEDFERGIIVADVVRLRVDEQFVSKKYLVLAINSDIVTTNLNLRTKGTIRPRVNLGHVRELVVPLAPLNEQKRIVDKVESLFGESKTARQALDKVPVLLRRFRQSVLTKAFKGELTERNPNDEPAQKLLERIEQERNKRRQTSSSENEEPLYSDLPELPETWAWTRIGGIFEVASGGTPRRNKPEYWNGAIPWVSSGEVAFCGITQTREHITKEGVENSSAKVCPPGTVLLALYGEGKTRGQAAVLRVPATTNQAIACILCSQTSIPPEYVYWWLYYRYLETRKLGEGANQPNIYLHHVRKMPFPLAPAYEQRAVVAIINQLFSLVDNIDASAQKARNASQTIDQAILAKAFRGELVPQDPNDEPASILLQRIKATSKQRISVQEKLAD
jgi:type I restriction enzyme S subunit